MLITGHVLFSLPSSVAGTSSWILVHRVVGYSTNLCSHLYSPRAGNITRITIPRSQGKQAYYDARKSAWGDIFPHPSKNKEVERYRPPADAANPVKKGDGIGKRGTNPNGQKVKYSYERLEGEIKNRKRDERRQRKRERSKSLELE